MPFKKGDPKPASSGKKLGCKHKINRDIRALLDELGCNPAEGLARIALTSRNESIRAKCNAVLIRYIHPELKSVELSGPGGGPIQANVTSDPHERVLSELSRIAATGDPGAGDKSPPAGGS